MPCFLNSKLCASQKQDTEDKTHGLVHQGSSESRASISESLSEYFDAQEILVSTSSSDAEVNQH